MLLLLVHYYMIPITIPGLCIQVFLLLLYLLLFQYHITKFNVAVPINNTLLCLVLIFLIIVISIVSSIVLTIIAIVVVIIMMCIMIIIIAMLLPRLLYLSTLYDYDEYNYNS